MSILDVASLKPDAEMAGISTNDAPRMDTKLYSSTTTVASSFNSANSFDIAKEHNGHELQRGKLHKKETNSTCRKNLLKDVNAVNQTDDRSSHSSETKSCSYNLDSCPTKSAPASKRKGDLEYELSLIHI